MSNTDIVRDAYATFSRREADVIDTAFAPDIEFDVPGQETMHGRDAVRAFFAMLAETFSVHTITLDDAVEAPGRVVAFVHHSFTAQDGTQATVEAVHDWRIEDGRLTSLHEVADTMALAAAFGQLSVPV